MELGHGSWSNKEQVGSEHVKTMTYIVYNEQAF